MDHREALHVDLAMLSWSLCLMRKVNGSLSSQGPACCHHEASIDQSLTLSCSVPNETIPEYTHDTAKKSMVTVLPNYPQPGSSHILAVAVQCSLGVTILLDWRQPVPGKQKYLTRPQLCLSTLLQLLPRGMPICPYVNMGAVLNL